MLWAITNEQACDTFDIRPSLTPTFTRFPTHTPSHNGYTTAIYVPVTDGVSATGPDNRFHRVVNRCARHGDSVRSWLRRIVATYDG